MRELIVWLAERTKGWRQLSIGFKERGDLAWASYNYEKYIEALIILRKVTAIDKVNKGYKKWIDLAPPLGEIKKKKELPGWEEAK
jgi:hypothetical protein